FVSSHGQLRSGLQHSAKHRPPRWARPGDWYARDGRVKSKSPMLDVLPLSTAPHAPAPAAEPDGWPFLRVIKFGGSSLATADRIRSVGRIVREAADTAPIVVVVSAFQGVTDELLACARDAERDGAAAGARYDALAARHREAAGHLVARND